MASIKWTIFEATFGITLLALFIQINCTENINQHPNPLQNEQNTTVSRSTPDFVISHPRQFSKDTIELHIIQTMVYKFAAILSNTHNELLHRHKRGSPNFLPPARSNNSSTTTIKNLLNILKQQLANLTYSESLSFEDKSRIWTLETTIKDLRTTLDRNEKEHSESMQITADKLETVIMMGIIQSINSSQLSFAETYLQFANDSIYGKIVQKFYNHQVDNIDLLLRFGESLIDLEKKFKLYDALYHKIRYYGNKDIQMLLRLGLSLRKETFKMARSAISDRIQFLIRSLYEECLNSSVTLFTEAFLQNEWESWLLVYKIKDEIRKSNDFQFLGNVYKKVVGKVTDTLSIGHFLDRLDRALWIPAEERIIIHEKIINKLESNGSLNNDSIISLVRHMKITWDDPKFNNTHLRQRYKIIINKLPRSLENIILSSLICIKNSYYNEYLYAEDHGDGRVDGYRRVGLNPGTQKYCKQASSLECKWKIDFHLDFHDFRISFHNSMYSNEYLNVHFNHALGNVNYYAITSNFNAWYVVVDGDAVRINFRKGRNQLFVAGKYDYQNAYYAGAYIDDNWPGDREPPSAYYTKWELVDCSNNSQNQVL